MKSKLKFLISLIAIFFVCSGGCIPIGSVREYNQAKFPKEMTLPAEGGRVYFQGSAIPIGIGPVQGSLKCSQYGGAPDSIIVGYDDWVTFRWRNLESIIYVDVKPNDTGKQIKQKFELDFGTSYAHITLIQPSRK